jgi:beta-lactamase class A
MDLIKQINTDTDNLISELSLKNKEIKDLRMQNEYLKESSLATLDQIREYIKELEQIKTHYVDSNNNSK